MVGELLRDKKGNVENTISLYQPSKPTRDFIAYVREDYSIGHFNMHKPYTEFNNRSVVNTMNDHQMAFNNYIPPRSQDPNESWKSQTVRPLTRNKVISIAAHITAQVVFPAVLAQNSNDQEDKEVASVMQDLMRWVMDQSRYETTFLFMVIGAMVNPCIYMKPEFVEVMQSIKRKDEKGNITKEEVVDEVFSGFNTFLIPCDEIFIANIYEYELQKQRFIIHRRFIEYEEAKAFWSDHEDFKYVRPGVRIFFDDDSGMFYEQKDDDLNTLVEEATYYNRTEDTQVTLVNGILVTSKDQRIKHRDNKDKPKYPLAKTGYEPIDEKHFYYYKSAVSKLMPDQDVLDQMWNMFMDGKFLDVMPPSAIIGGNDETDNTVIIPGATNYYPENTQIVPMGLGRNTDAGLIAIQALENSMSESTQDPRSGGSAGEKITARQFIGEENNARVQLGLFLRMISNIVEDFGDLMQDIIIHHMTVGQVEEITAGQSRMKFRTFLIPDQVEDGRKITKSIQFTNEFADEEMDEDRELKESFKLFKEEGALKATKKIYKVNPSLFSQMKFKTVMKSERLISRSEELERLLSLEAYDRMIVDPTISSSPESLRAVSRDFLVEPLAKGESDKYLPAAGLTLPEVQAPKAKKGGKVEQLSNNVATGLTI